MPPAVASSPQFTKPAQSLAPVFIVYVLPQLAAGGGGGGGGATSAAPDAAQALAMVWAVPAATALLQVAIWSLYTLRGEGPVGDAAQLRGITSVAVVDGEGEVRPADIQADAHTE